MIIVCWLSHNFLIIFCVRFVFFFHFLFNDGMVMQHLHHTNYDRTHVDWVQVCAVFASDARLQLVVLLATDMKNY